MKNSKLLKKSLKIANQLDKIGRYVQSDIITASMKKYSIYMFLFMERIQNAEILIDAISSYFDNSDFENIVSENQGYTSDSNLTQYYLSDIIWNRILDDLEQSNSNIRNFNEKTYVERKDFMDYFEIKSELLQLLKEVQDSQESIIGQKKQLQQVIDESYARDAERIRDQMSGPIPEE